MLAQKIKEGIYWVGAIDWGLRSFHGYATDKGSTYNAFLILDEKITLVDNVKAPFAKEMMARISSIIDPSKIDVIISNHGEPDHSGAILEVLAAAPKAKVYSSAPNGVKILKAIYGENLPIVPVKTNDTLSIGKRTLTFYQAPMVHWPDNMVTYIEEEKMLFSNDIFGQHFATSNLMDSECDLDTILFEAKKYYANIVLPYTRQARKITETVKTMDIEYIMTSHGVSWKDHIDTILALYEDMTTSKKQEKAIVVYDTMWGNTKEMALAITEAFRAANVPVRLYNVNDTEHADLITEIMDATYLAVGSSTLNNNLLPPIAAFLTYLKGMAPVGLKTIAFGSYGWGGQSITQVASALEEMGYTPLLPPMKSLYNPKPELLTQMATDIINVLKS